MEFKRRTEFTTNPRLPVEPPADPPAPDPPQSRLRRRLRLLWRSSARLIVALALAAVGFGLFVYFHAWSNSFVDARLQREWRLATGIDLRFSKAVFRLSRGQIEVERPVLIDPDNGRQLLAAERLSLEFPVLRFLLSRPPFILDSIDLKGPFDIQLGLNDGGAVVPGAPWDRILALLRERQAPVAADANASTDVGIGHITLGPINLALNDRRSGAGGAPIVQLGQAAIEANFEGTLEPKQVLVRGRLNGRAEDDSFRLTLRPGLAGGGAAYSLLLADLDSRRDFPGVAMTPWQAHKTELQGEFSRSPAGVLTVAAKAAIGQLLLPVAEGLPSRELGPAKLEWALDFDLATARMAIQRLDLESDYGRLHASGSVSVVAPFAYSMHVDPVELPGRGIEAVERFVPILRGLTNPRDASLKLAGEAAGNFASPAPSALTGRVQLSGVDWNSPEWPAPLTGVRLDAQLSSRTLAVEKLQGAVAGMPVEFKGTVAGNLLAGNVSQIDLSWTAIGTAEGLMSLIPPSADPAKPLPKLAGNLTGQGSLRIVDPMHGSIDEVLQRSSVSGGLMMQGGSINDPSLPGPMEELNGRIEFSLASLNFNRLAGRFLGVDFTMDGSLSGDPAFWIAPAVRAHFAAKGEAAQLVPVIASRLPELRKAIDTRTPTTGRLGLDLTFEAPLAHPSAAVYAGSVRIEDGTTSISLPWINGPVRIDRAEFALSTDTLRIAGLKGALGSVAIEADATMTPVEGQADVKIDGTLAEVKARVPPILKDFEVGGKGVVRAHANYKRRDDAPQIRRWTELQPLFDAAFAVPAGRGGDAVTTLSKLVEYHLAGDVQGQDVEMTFHAMPTRLRGMSGALKLDEHHLWSVDPLTAEGGEGGKGLTSSFEVVFPSAGHPAEIRFDAQGDHFPLGAWTTEWHVQNSAENAPGYADRYPKDYKIDPSEPEALIIVGHVRSKTVSFMRLNGQDFDGGFRYIVYPFQPNILTWNEVKSGLYGGQLTASGDLANAQLHNEVQLAGVNLADLATALSGEKSRPQGIFSGMLSGDAVIDTGFERFDSPPTGKGNLEIVKSRFVSNSVFGRLGAILNLPIFDDVSFSKIRGPFMVEYPLYKTSGIVFENPITNLEMSGVVGPADALDLDLKVQFLRIVGDIPLVGDVMGIFNKLAGSLLRFHVSGTVDKPSVTPL